MQAATNALQRFVNSLDTAFESGTDFLNGQVVKVMRLDDLPLPVGQLHQTITQIRRGAIVTRKDSSLLRGIETKS